MYSDISLIHALFYIHYSLMHHVSFMAPAMDVEKQWQSLFIYTSTHLCMTQTLSQFKKKAPQIRFCLLQNFTLFVLVFQGMHSLPLTLLFIQIPGTHSSTLWITNWKKGSATLHTGLYMRALAIDIIKSCSQLESLVQCVQHGTDC